MPAALCAMLIVDILRKTEVSVKTWKTAVIAAGLALLWTSSSAKHSDAYLLGNFSYLRANSGFLPRVDSLAARMKEAGYNASVCEIVQGSTPAQIGKLIGTFDRFGIDAIVTDKVWSETGINPQFGSEALSLGNYWRFEAEYDSSSALNQNSDRYFYMNTQRVGEAVPKAQASGGWVWRLKDGKSGFASRRLQFRWPNVAKPPVRYNIGPEFRFLQRALGSGSQGEFALNPSANDTLYITFAFRCEDLPEKQSTPLCSLAFQGYATETEKQVRRVAHFDPRTGRSQPITVLTVKDYLALPELTKDGEGNPVWPHRELTLAVPLSELNAAGLLDLTKGWRFPLRNLNPRLYWQGYGSLELDYVEFEDTMHRDLAGNAFLRDRARQRVAELASNYDNISHFFLTDEPTAGQFDSFRIIEQDLFKDLKTLAPTVSGLMSCSWIYRSNVLKDDGNNYNLVALFDEVAQPEILMFDIYPLFGSIRWNRPEVTRGLQKTLEMDMLKYYKQLKQLCVKRGAKFMPITQSYGVWVSDPGRWGNLRPPRLMQKCLQLLPLCYGADAVINFKLYDEIDPGGKTPAYQPYSPLNLTDSNGKIEISANPNWETLIEANRKILAYAEQLKTLRWLDADAIGTSGYPGRDQLAAAGLASLKVLPQELSENGIDLYDGYVQCGLFADPAGLPQLMLVNRRTEYVPPRPGSNKDDADELQFVPNRELDAACLPAPPQSLRMAAAAETLSRLGSYAGWWDSYSGKVYPCGEGGCEVEIGPGDGMLLALVGTLPARVGSAAILSGKAVVAGPTVLASGARVSQDVKSTLLVTGDITVESGASLVLRGEVEVADGVHIYVRPGGLVDLKDARLRWGKKSGLVKL